MNLKNQLGVVKLYERGIYICSYDHKSTQTVSKTITMEELHKSFQWAHFAIWFENA